jgi:hypothetical protein
MATFGSLRAAQLDHITRRFGADAAFVKAHLVGLLRECEEDMEPVAETEQLLATIRCWMVVGFLLVIPAIVLNCYLMCCARSTAERAQARAMDNARRRVETSPAAIALGRYGISVSVEEAPRGIQDVTVVWWQLYIPIPTFVISQGMPASA